MNKSAERVWLVLGCWVSVLKKSPFLGTTDFAIIGSLLLFIPFRDEGYGEKNLRSYFLSECHKQIYMSEQVLSI